MVSIDVLFHTMLVLLIIEVFVLRNDLLSPAFLFTASFLACIISTSFMADKWGIREIDKGTYSIIVIATVIFMLVDIMFKSICFSKYKYSNLADDKTIVIDNPRYLVYVDILVSVLALCLGVTIIMRFKSGSIHDTMERYKYVVNSGLAEGGGVLILGPIKLIVNQLMKLSEVLTYFLLFAYTDQKRNNNLSKKDHLLYLLSFVIYIVARFFISGSRQREIFFIIAWISCAALMGISRSSKKVIKRNNRRFALKMGMITALILPAFYYLGFVAGRRQQDIIFEAFFGYLTTGIYGLNTIIHDRYRSNYWGQVTFSKESAFLAFFRHGNTVTILGRWYWDWGSLGAIIMIIIVAFIFSALYYYGIRYTRNKTRNDICTIMYTYLCHILFFAGYDDFASQIFGKYYIQIEMGLLLLYFMVYMKKVKIRAKAKKKPVII